MGEEFPALEGRNQAFLLWTGRARELYPFLEPHWICCSRVSEALTCSGEVGGTGDFIGSCEIRPSSEAGCGGACSPRAQETTGG